MSTKEKENKEDEESKELVETGENGESVSGPTKGKRKLLIVIGAAVVAVLIALGVMFSGILGGGGDKDKGYEESSHATENASGEAGSMDPEGGPPKPVYYELPEFLVNLTAAPGKVSFLKMSVTLELRDQASVAIVEASKPRIIDAFNTYLREVRPTDLAGSAGIFRLRGELMARINRTVEEGLVKDILFSQIIVQ
jgi:flagellar FliL protein